jgi:hypothetical protein
MVVQTVVMDVSRIQTRRRGRFLPAMVLIILMGGCGSGVDKQPTVRAADVAQQLQAATGLPLKAVQPPTGLPGLPELATTLSGGTTYESLTVFVFFEPEGIKRLLGTGRKPEDGTVLVRSNVVVLYRTSPTATNKSQQIRRALDALMVGT